MKKVFKIFYFLFTFHILSIAKFCQIKSWIYRHLSIIAKFKKKRKNKNKNWIQDLVWGYSVGNVTWDLGEHWLLLVPSPETLVCYFTTRARCGIVFWFCFVARRLLRFGASATIFLPCLRVFEGQLLAFYTALLSLTAPISFYWIIAPPFLPTKCFFCFSYD